MVRRRIRKATIQRIALCARPKNGLTTLYKAETGEIEFVTLTKMGSDALLHALVYVPDMVDSDGDSADKDTIQDFAHTFIREGAHFDINHKGDPLTSDQIYLAESTIVQKGDTRFEGFTDAAGNPVNPVGGWGIIAKVLDPDLEARIKSGDLGGVSLFGPAVVEIVKSNDVPKEVPMTPEQMKALMEGLSATLSKSVADAVQSVLPKVETKVEPKREAVAFEGDPMNVEDLIKHQDKILFASLDLSKAEDVQKWTKHIASRKPSGETQKTELEKAQAQLAAAQAQLATLQKGSNQGAGEAQGTPSGDIVGLTKSENENAARAISIAQLLNKQNGRV